MTYSMGSPTIIPQGALLHLPEHRWKDGVANFFLKKRCCTYLHICATEENNHLHWFADFKQIYCHNNQWAASYKTYPSLTWVSCNNDDWPTRCRADMWALWLCSFLAWSKQRRAVKWHLQESLPSVVCLIYWEVFWTLLGWSNKSRVTKARSEDVV